MGIIRLLAPAAFILLALSILAPSSLLHAQSRHPLPPDHWSRDLLSTLRGLGVPEGEFLLVGGISGAGALEALNGTDEAGAPRGGAVGGGESVSPLGAFLRTWGRRLRAEVGEGDAGSGGGVGGGYLIQLQGGWSDSPALPFRVPGGFGRLLVAGDPVPGVTVWGEGLVSTDGRGDVVRSAGIAFPLGSFDAFLGRLPLAMGQGRDPFLLNGRVPLDGAFLNSRRPFRLPGSLTRLGEFRFHLGMSPFISSPLTSSAWFGSFALSWSPHPRVDLGVMRTTRFAGKDIEPFNWTKFFQMLAWQGQNDAFDDSQGEVAARVRWGLGGQPLVTYLSFGFEDRSSITEDPGLLLGAQLPILRPGGVFTLSYEFTAIGRRAYWCGSCEKSIHAWYLSPKFGAYTMDGVFLGSALGGYGASHRGRVDAWLSGTPLRAWAEFQRLERDYNNVLREPSVVGEKAPQRVESWTVGIDAFLGSRWGLMGSIQTATLDGERKMGGEAAIRILAGR